MNNSTYNFQRFSPTLFVIKFSYIYIPLVAFTYKYIVGNSYTKFFFDILFLFALFCIFVRIFKVYTIRYNRFLLSFILLSALFSFSLVLNHLHTLIFYNRFSDFYIGPFIMTIKLPVYFLLGSLFVLCFKPINLLRFVVYTRFFCFLTLIDFMVRFIIEGNITRTSILSESNYDSLLILIGLCSLFNLPKDKKFLYDYILVGLAILVTQSKTSIGCFVLLSVYQFSSRQYLKYFLFLLLFSLVSFPIILSRLSVVPSLDQIDRVLMWASYVNLLRESSVFEFLFGFSPGYYLSLYDDNLWFFISHLSQRVGAEGLHSFNFHSLWLRIAIDYGFIFLLVVLFVLIYFFVFYKTLRPFIIMIFIQGFTMGFFYLSVSILSIFVYMNSQVNNSFNIPAKFKVLPI